jgi:acetyltransferase-like isoleucine patch superfamily enzyme
MPATFIKKLGGYLTSPGDLVYILLAVIRGSFYIVKYRFLSNRDVIINFPFFCHTRVRISGEGKVRIGPGCSVFINNFEHLSVLTLTEEAVVTIGKKCSLGGATIRCANRVSIGDHVMTAASLIQDVPFFSQFMNDKSAGVAPDTAISVGDHVWLSARTIVLSGSSIGNAVVLGVGAFICGEAVNDGYLALGNPLRRPIPIASLITMKTCKDER